MQVDHGFSQPLHNVCGGVARYPVLPCINTVPAHSRHSDESGCWEKRSALLSGDRDAVAFRERRLIASSGEYFSARSCGCTDKVKNYLMYGPGGGDMTVSDWHRYLGEQTVLGGRSVIEGGARQRISALTGMGRTIPRALTKGDYSVFDSWDDREIVRDAGVAAMESSNGLLPHPRRTSPGCNPLSWTRT
jgi:hypothetical protein